MTNPTNPADGDVVTHGIALAILCELRESHDLKRYWDTIHRYIAQQRAIDDGLDFEPDAQHTVSDMANIGYSLMQRLPKNYNWNNTPAEIVGDLLNQIADLKAAAQQSSDQGSGEVDLPPFLQPNFGEPETTAEVDERVRVNWRPDGVVAVYELLPCPFCGSKAASLGDHSVNCTNTECDACHYYVGPQTWNRRAALTAKVKS